MCSLLFFLCLFVSFLEALAMGFSGQGARSSFGPSFIVAVVVRVWLWGIGKGPFWAKVS